MKKKKLIAGAAALGVVASLAAAAPAAYAEPVSNSYAIVGSDTLQDVVNALTNGTNISGAVVRSTAGDQFVGAFDATGTPSIQTKSGGQRFGRPNGSGDGVKALSRSIDGQPYTSGTAGGPANVLISNQVDIARSSSGPGSSANPTGPLVYLPFGRDALTYAHSGTAAAFDSLDQATLKGIFECTVRTVGGVTVTPVIPQAGSGTRSDWMSKIGVTDATLGSCVVVGQEHDTSRLSDGSAFPANAITPMSAAQWVAQNTGAGIDRRGTNVKLGSPVAGTPAVTGTGTSMVPNAAFYANTTWGRDVFLVVENARITVGDAKYDAKLADLVSTAGSKLNNAQSALPSQAGTVKRKFGFLAPSSTTPQRSNLR